MPRRRGRAGRGGPGSSNAGALDVMAALQAMLFGGGGAPCTCGGEPDPVAQDLVQAICGLPGSGPPACLGIAGIEGHPIDPALVLDGCCIHAQIKVTEMTRTINMGTGQFGGEEHVWLVRDGQILWEDDAAAYSLDPTQSVLRRLSHACHTPGMATLHIRQVSTDTLPNGKPIFNLMAFALIGAGMPAGGQARWQRLPASMVEVDQNADADPEPDVRYL